jgi:carbonic anhydrase
MKSSRRDMIRAMALGSAALAVGSIPVSAAAPARRVPRSPEEAVKRLLDGNRRFVSGDVEAPRRSLDRVREVSGGQAPYAAILGCADSRVPVEILFDEGFGDLFTVRVAGNVATPEEIASLEYSVGVLGSQVVVVLGHSACGAVTAAIQGKAVPGQISALFQHIAPSVPRGTDVARGVEMNVVHQVEVLKRSSTVLQEAMDAGKVVVIGAVYDLGTGRVTVLD